MPPFPSSRCGETIKTLSLVFQQLPTYNYLKNTILHLGTFRPTCLLKPEHPTYRDPNYLDIKA
jgi:hypothetical protein